MKKILIALTLALSVGAADAVPAMRPAGHAQTINNNMYHVGYRHGKNDAYDNVAKTAVIVGFAVIAGVIIYELGRESRWATNEKGVVYRF